VPVKRPIFRYCVLAFLFAITVAYEVPYLHDILRDETRKVAFFTMEAATDRVDIVTKETAQAGIQKGDEVLSIGGRPYNGLGDWAQPLAATPIGGSIAIVLRSSDPSSPGERTVVLPVGAAPMDLWRLVGALTLYFLLPAIRDLRSAGLLGHLPAPPRPDGLAVVGPDADLSSHRRKLQSGGLASRLARSRDVLPCVTRLPVAARDVPVRQVLPRTVCPRHTLGQSLEVPAMGPGRSLHDLRDGWRLNRSST
jgi:hypothetical protein